VHGAAVLIRSSAFPGPHVFVDHYFLFFEELELAERARAQGRHIGFCPECHISHFEGGSRQLADDDFVSEVTEYFENLNAIRFTRDHHPLALPTVLLFRVLGKLLVLTLRGEGRRLVFWFLAITDALRFQVRRFPFQAGWQPQPGRDRIVDSKWPWLATP
jgi:GT2 family glycosyltransferase